jgi:hypothetical protein
LAQFSFLQGKNDHAISVGSSAQNTNLFPPPSSEAVDTLFQPKRASKDNRVKGLEGYSRCIFEGSGKFRKNVTGEGTHNGNIIFTLPLL